MLKKILLALSFALLCAAPAFSADEPTMHEVYLAAESGRFIEAQSMLDKVLKEHPNSAKAHFVQAEVLAKQGLRSGAQAELRTAERLAPGLPFVKPQALQGLRAAIATPTAATPSVARAVPVQQTAPDSGMPWGLLLGGAGVIALAIWAFRAMARRNAMAVPANAYPAYAGGAGMQPMGAAGGMPVGPTAGGGMGSGIMGGLATGAALGAGMVAGQALMHHFTDGNRTTPDHVPPAADNFAPAPNDMGGQDFGVNDASSWDDGGAGGGDWD